jgi:hypothetical protein
MLEVFLIPPLGKAHPTLLAMAAAFKRASSGEDWQILQFHCDLISPSAG